MSLSSVKMIAKLYFYKFLVTVSLSLVTNYPGMSTFRAAKAKKKNGMKKRKGKRNTVLFVQGNILFSTKRICEMDKKFNTKARCIVLLPLD